MAHSEIRTRRNAQLREMHRLWVHRDNICAVKYPKAEEADVQEFLEQFDLVEHPDTGTIEYFMENEVFPSNIGGLLRAHAPSVRAHASGSGMEREGSPSSSDDVPLVRQQSRSHFSEPDVTMSDVADGEGKAHVDASAAPPSPACQADRSPSPLVAKSEPEEPSAALFSTPAGEAEASNMDDDHLSTPPEETAQPLAISSVPPSASSSPLPQSQPWVPQQLRERYPPDTRPSEGANEIPKVESEDVANAVFDFTVESTQPTTTIDEQQADAMDVDEAEKMGSGAVEEGASDAKIEAASPQYQPTLSQAPQMAGPSTTPLAPLSIAPADLHYGVLPPTASEDPLTRRLGRIVTLRNKARSPSPPPQYDFSNFQPEVKPPATPPGPPPPVYAPEPYDPGYTLPSLSDLPVDFNKKATSRKRKRDKQEIKRKEQWQPIGLNEWGAAIRANPVWKKVSKSTKCLSTKEWGIAYAELKLIRTLDRMELMKDYGRWSFRQPKKQRNVGVIAKTHWDYLMDEMQWMRTDFREERRWKYAVAFNIATAVLEWHAAGDPETRVAKGICVKWKRPPPPEDVAMGDADAEVADDQGMEVDDGTRSPSRVDGAIVDYGSEEEDDDEQEKLVADELQQPESLFDDALQTAERAAHDPGIGMTEADLKHEDIEPTFDSNDNAMAVDGATTHVPSGAVSSQKASAAGATPVVSGLKTDSTDPALHTTSDKVATRPDAPPVKHHKSSAFAGLRERIAYSDSDKLFLELDDFVLQHDGRDTVSNLADIFADLQPYTIFDPPSSAPAPPLPDSKEKDRRKRKEADKFDPHRRVDETMVTKLYPVGKFMHTKPTLLGPLQPAHKWQDGHWVNLDDSAVAPEEPQPRGGSNEPHNNLWPANPNHPRVDYEKKYGQGDRRRMEPWTPAEDAQLKALADRYNQNFALVAEAFNAGVTIARRTERECFERYADKWPRPATRLDQVAMAAQGGTEVTPPPPTPSTSMMTRGVKRGSISTPTAPIITGVGGSEQRKRRRHTAVTEIVRRGAKKRIENQQKQLAQRKPSVVHETHNQYNKYPRLSPAELSRMKAEREARVENDMAIARRRQEELVARQAMAARQQQQQQQQVTQAGQSQAQPGQPHPQAVAQNAAGQLPTAQNAQQPVAQIPPAQQAQQHPQQLQQMQTANGQRAGSAGALAVPQTTRAAVQNISGQPRAGSSVSGTPRISPQQILQAQQAAARQNQMLAQSHAMAASPAQSPPLSTGTPVNATNSPRPPSAQAGAGQRASYYIPNMTAEQMMQLSRHPQLMYGPYHQAAQSQQQQQPQQSPQQQQAIPQPAQQPPQQQ
uniref:Vacuolar import and degradation protein 21 n=1 Tax=Schizophyllum commune (strain H4-8 / FGSC 9210) TaxID=578458 RepID=D8PVQ8_SCHCM